MGDEDKAKTELLEEVAHLQEQCAHLQEQCAHLQEQCTYLRAELASVQDCSVNLERYVRAVSHDIKQPLGLIVGYSEFLLELYQDDSLDDELRRDIALIAHRGRLASDLLTELMALLYVPQVDIQTCAMLDMATVFDQAHHRLANVISELGVDIVVPQRWPPACGRALLVEQLWVKILGYALRLHPRAAIRRLWVGGTLIPDSEMVRFWVRCEASIQTPHPSPIWPSSTDAAALAEHLPVAYCIARKLGGEVGLDHTHDEPNSSIVFFTLLEGRVRD